MVGNTSRRAKSSVNVRLSAARLLNATVPEVTDPPISTQVSPLCKRFAEILDGTPEIVNGVCTVTRIRKKICPFIQGRPSRSPLSIAAMFSYESPDQFGNTLNLGETVILQTEINPFITALRGLGVQVTALHNDWLFTQPRLYYIHFESVEAPLAFAGKIAEAFKVLC